MRGLHFYDRSGDGDILSERCIFCDQRRGGASLWCPSAPARASRNASTCGGPEMCGDCALADDHEDDDGQGLRYALLSHFGYEESMRRVEAPLTRPDRCEEER